MAEFIGGVILTVIAGGIMLGVTGLVTGLFLGLGLLLLGGVVALLLSLGVYLPFHFLVGLITDHPVSAGIILLLFTALFFLSRKKETG